jgi:hypothetical protein
MTVSATLQSGDVAPLPDASAIPAFIFPTETGAAGTYQFNPGDDAHASLGSSMGTEGTLWFLRNAKQPCVVGVCAATAGTKSAITHSGSGPTVTAGYTGSLTGPLLSLSIGAKVLAGGLNGAASIGYYLDGSGDFAQYTAPIPQEAPAVLTGVIDISNGAVLSGYVAGALTYLHVDSTLPSAEVLTFGAGSLAAAAAGLKVATATVTSVVVLTAADLLAAGKTALLANPRKLLFTTAGGTAADAPATVAIVGTRYGAALSETLALGQTAIAVSSVNTYDVITSLTYTVGDGTGATIAIGYSDAFATAQEIVDAFNVLAVAAPLDVRARASQTATATYFELYSTTAGAALTMTLDLSASTADTPLGLTTASATGAAATLPIPFTGLTLTFAAGTYVEGDVYTMTTTGPTASTAAIATAADAIRNSDFPFGFIAPLTVPSSATNARGLCDALDAKIADWDSDEEAAIFPIQLTAGPWHVASATPATNATNIATVDQALLAAFAGHASIGTVVPGDGYATGSNLVGSYRVPALLGVAYMLAAFKLSDDPGAASHKAIPEWSLMAPDLVTGARDQANRRTVNKLGGSRGPGFTVLSTVSKGPRVKRGVTRAGLTSRLVDLGSGLRMGRRGQEIMYQTAKNGVENENYQVGADGRLLEVVRRALEGAFSADLGDALLTPPLNDNASSVSVVITASEVIANTSNITITGTLQKLGSAENVTIKAVVAGTVVSTTIA